MWTKPVHIQSIMVIQPCDLFDDGRQNMCDGCPDAIFYQDKLVWSCRVDELEKFGAFIQCAPRSCCGGGTCAPQPAPAPEAAPAPEPTPVPEPTPAPEPVKDPGPTPTPAPTTTSPSSRSTRPMSPRSTRRSPTGAARPA